MWNSWNPGAMASGPVDWAAKAAEWARQQSEKAAPPPPPPPPPEEEDTVENETEMEDAMPQSVSGHTNEWSAVTDSARGQYSSSDWQNGGDNFTPAGYPPSGMYPPPSYYPESEGYHGNDGGGYQAPPYSQGAAVFESGEEYQSHQPSFPKQVESGFPERLPPPPTHTAPMQARNTFRETTDNTMHNLSGAELQRRKALPAWIRDGLNKMEKNRNKETPPNTELIKRPRATDVTGYEKLSGRGSTASINRNKISGYSALQESGASSDEKGDGDGDGDSDDEQPVTKMDPVLFVKRALTTILLEGTTAELRSVVLECLQQEKAIQQLDELCKKKESHENSGLDLVSYNNHSSSSSSSSSSDSSSEEESKDRQQKSSDSRLPDVSLKLDVKDENGSSKSRTKSNSSQPSTDSPKISTSSKRKSQVSEDIDIRKSKLSKKSSDKGEEKDKKKSEKKRSHRSVKDSGDDRERSHGKSKKSRHSTSSEHEKENGEKTKHKLEDRKESSKDRERKRRKSVKEEVKVKKVQELNKKIEDATRKVEKKVKNSRKKREKSSSSSSSRSSSSSEDRRETEKKKKGKPSKHKRKDAPTPVKSRRKSESSATDRGRKYSSSSSDRKHKGRKR